MSEFSTIDIWSSRINGPDRLFAYVMAPASTSAPIHSQTLERRAFGCCAGVVGTVGSVCCLRGERRAAAIESGDHRAENGQGVAVPEWLDSV
jgi:hypothetical protein